MSYKPMITLAVAMGLVVACVALGMVVYVPSGELVAGFRRIFNTLEGGAQVILVIIAAAVAVVATAAAARSIHRAWAGAQMDHYRVQLVAAEVRQADRDTRLKITAEPLGSQIFAHELTADGFTHTPLHLLARRVNGVEIPPTPDEVMRWALPHYTHGTNRQPGPLPGLAEPAALLPATAGSAGQLPTLVRWFDLVPGHRGNLNNLVLGVRLDEAGRPVPVTISLYDLFHTIIAASTGWGKSALANSILAQLATCREPVEFVVVDQQLHGLTAFKNCDRLRYPILRENKEILSALREVYAEAKGHRSELFERYDADDLADYNRQADEFLPPVIVVVDEASSLLGNKEIGTELKQQAWELRKFGVYQILLLTSAKGTTIDTDHRQQFSSKVQMHANDRYQARLLLDAPEATTFPAGRAVIELPGQSSAVIQTPYITRPEVRSLLRPGSPPPAPPALELATEDGPTLMQQMTLDLWDAGERTWSAIARQVYGDGGGRQCELVRKTLEKFNRL